MFKYLKFGFSSFKLYLFPGQGTQQIGMFNTVKQKYSHIIHEVSQMINININEITQTDSQKIINKPHIAQPLVVLSSYLQAKFKNIQIQKHDFMIGHSIGQYTALLLAQSINLEDCMKITKIRGQLIQKYTKQQSGMLVVIAKTEDLEKIQSLIKSYDLQIGCYNTLTQLVISGTKTKTRQLYKQFRTNHILCTFLPVQAAFHCSSLKAMSQQFQQALSKIKIFPPKCSIIRNIDTKVYSNVDDIVQGLVKQLYNPVRFYDSVLKVPKQIQFMQLSHKPIATRFIKQIRR